ncbi:RIP metalloprotease RseP [Helicobacter sp. 16-1353]|uniref:RIP metalloprotease RseP n=1 Tax=Helicobacter sp. 16-1353 TaxID=2004996 RepID=UPI000DCECD96|nr:RIP metalloprotease RseP [Helicobacter sp. 16-1353]RAX55360.1 RIP metalloprotease RseP [Helicobacter sp. 16-1353]
MWLIVSILVLSFLIFFHESGHFLVARLFGVKVEVFSIGFGKKIWTKTYKGTQYAISAIPLGGYVKMKGQDDLNPNEINSDDDSYNTKAPWKRICILFAGSGANILLAFLLYIIIGISGINSLLPIIGDVVKDSPAQNAGLIANDKIVKIDDKNIKTWRDMSDYISKKNTSINIEYQRNGQLYQTTLTPKIQDSKNIFGEDIKQGFIGIKAKGEVGKVNYTLSEIIPFAFNETLFAGKLILLGIQKLITGILPTSQLGGPIAIVQIISQAQEAGIIALLGLSALISINLGILNLFPIPALDGGHIVFTAYEWISKKPLSETTIYRLTIFGWILLFALMILGLYNDISRIATNIPLK